MRMSFAGRALRLTAAVIVIAGLGAGASYALAGSSKTLTTSVIQACQNRGNGTLRVVADPTSCHAGETPISWNVAGPPGPPGADGAGPTVTALSPGDANCASGGAAITDAAGHVAYVCSGAPFDGTFTSPNGQYTLTVSDTGIRLGAPGNQTLTISGTGMRLDGDSIELRSDTNLTLRAGNNLDARGDSNVSFRGGASLAIDGPTVTVNGGGSCPEAARAGDLVANGAILTGSPTVCIGP